MESNLNAIFKTDKRMEMDGIWFEVLPGVKFRLKRFGGWNSEKLKPLYATHYKPFARQIETGNFPADKEKEIMTTIFIRACLVEWEGVEIDGVKAECNLENSLKLFTNLPDLLETLTAYCQDSKNFREDLGNS